MEIITREEVDAVKDTIQDHINKYGVDRLTGRLIHTKKQSTTMENRREFRSLQGVIRAVHYEILKRTGIDLIALRELGKVDYSKTTAQKLFFIARELHTNYKVVEQESTKF